MSHPTVGVGGWMECTRESDAHPCLSNSTPSRILQCAGFDLISKLLMENLLPQFPHHLLVSIPNYQQVMGSTIVSTRIAPAMLAIQSVKTRIDVVADDYPTIALLPEGLTLHFR